jgi:hypothetical protein
MSNLQYRNPITPFITLNPVSVSRNEVFGTNFSVLGVGGYMEVYNLSDLNYTIPAGRTGTIEFTGNTIPIEFKKGTGSAFSTDVLVLNSDNISSGRRRLGMLVYVYETDRIYQYTIRNYDSLWSAATASTGPGGRTVVISSFGTTVKSNSVAGQNFINAWTASTIEGVSGYNNSNATWRVLSTGSSSGGTVSGDYLPLSGGTVTGATNFTNGLSANTISATTYLNLPVTNFTGGTVSGTTNFTGGLSANTFSATTYFNLPVTNFTGGTVSGATNFTNGLTANTISATTYQNLPVTADTFVTGFSLSNNTINLAQNRNDQFSAFSISLSAYTGTSVTGDYLPLSGGSVTGGTSFTSGLSANTISATTYQNINAVTGGTYSNGIITLSGTGNVNGNTITGLSTITADTFVTGFTFNASNYNLTINQNNGQSPLTQSLSILASDLYVTGGTYNSNTGVATFTNNTGGTFQVSGFLTGFTDTLVTAFTYNNNTFTITDSRGTGFTATINTMTGLTATTISATTYFNLPVTNFTGGTVSGATNFTDGLSANTFSATTYLNLPSATFTGGTVSGPTNFLSGLTANTISATTYQNLPVTADTFTTAATYSVSTGIITFNRNNNTPNYTVTGLTGFTSAFTYSNNVFTISRSGTSNLTALINTVTGFTINGNLTVTGTSTVNNLTITGTTALNGPINSGTLSGSTTRMLEVSSGGSVTATKEIITAYITSGGTASNLLENTSNWSINGVYTGTTITGTFQGQKHYNNNYFFEAVADNIFIRLIRG